MEPSRNFKVNGFVWMMQTYVYLDIFWITYFFPTKYMATLKVTLHYYFIADLVKPIRQFFYYMFWLTGFLT